MDSIRSNSCLNDRSTLSSLADLIRSPLSLGQTRSLPRYRELVLRFQQAILSGQLKAGEQLPSTRELAEELGVSRNTIKNTYELLHAEGYIDTRKGSGSYVANLPDHLLQKTDRLPVVNDSLNVTHLSRKTDKVSASSGLKLQPAMAALDQFPMQAWKRCVNVAQASRGLLQSAPLAGDELLREAIVKHLLIRRGVQAASSQVVITSGSQEALYLVSRLLLKAGDEVLVEAPGYQGTYDVVAQTGARIQSISWQTLQQKPENTPNAKLLCLTPSRNFPLGHTLGLSSRLTLLAWAEQNQSWILEDDFDCEFATGPVVSALLGLSENQYARQRVIYTGTFSRTVFPALRLGYVVLPKELVAPFLALRNHVDGGLSRLPQHALAHFMISGEYSRHLKKMRLLYQQRRTVMENALAASGLSDWPIIDAGGGMYLVLAMPEASDDVGLCQSLAQQGFGVRPLSVYDPLTRQSGLVLGFSAEPEEKLASLVNELASLIGSYQTIHTQ
ncbi:MAG: PLP-dependent aminotransferase family protein [Oceanospirillales bacterium]|nr:MAG: PLP-dependent aminotransferase family protein [Oceanospirillales bacterium]